MYDSLLIAIQVGLLYSIPAISVCFAFRVIGFPDLTPDGSFVLGASVGGILILNGAPEWVALSAGFFSGASAGVITSLLHTKLNISKLLSGILVMTMLYSISLRVMNTSNLSLMRTNTFIGNMSNLSNLFSILVIGLLCLFFYMMVWVFLKTKLGIKLRALGDSEDSVNQRGYNKEPLFLIGLAIVNGISATSGVIISQYQGFVDVSMGTGLVIICLAAMIIGETVLRPQYVSLLVLSPIIGMIIYQIIISIALRLGLAASDLKIATAFLAIIFIALDRFRFQVGKTGRQIGNRNF